jgi:hypothetical protein
MNNKYIIVNKTAIEKRIEELKIIEKQESMNASLLVREEIETLKRVLTQSTPLIPEIEKAFDVGSERGEFGYGNANDKHDYISNLKLDI